MIDPALREILSGLAIKQHGVVSRRQLVSAWGSEEAVDRLVRSGWLRVLHRGVYLLGAVAPPLAPELAACLACGPGAALSHRSAGTLWAVLPDGARPDVVEVSIRVGRRVRPGIRVYRAHSLQGDEVTVRSGVPITTATRTLLDLARLLRPVRLERAVAEAVALRLTCDRDIRAMITRHPGVHGAHRLRAVMGTGGPRLTRSEAEERFLSLLRSAGIDVPKANARVAGHEVDFYWPDRGLVAEVDGRAFHTSRRSFERDRRRDAELLGVGIRVVRVTWQQLTEQPEALLVRLGAVLAGH
jgi:very-short-patch-repair endonuclease